MTIDSSNIFIQLDYYSLAKPRLLDNLARRTFCAARYSPCMILVTNQSSLFFTLKLCLLRINKLKIKNMKAQIRSDILIPEFSLEEEFVAVMRYFFLLTNEYL